MRVPYSGRIGGKFEERKVNGKIQGVAKIPCPVSPSCSRIFQNLELLHHMAVRTHKCGDDHLLQIGVEECKPLTSLAGPA